MRFSSLNLLLGNLFRSKSLHRLLVGDNASVKIGEFDFSIKDLPQAMQSAIWFGFHERSEARAIRKFLPSNLPVVELGACSGFTTAQVLSKTNNVVISVEANPVMSARLAAWQKELNISRLSVVQAAINYEGPTLRLLLDPGLLGSRLVKLGEGQAQTDRIEIECPSITLGELLADGRIEQYTLVSDIEGAEAQLLNLETPKVIGGCEHIQIELHDCEWGGKQYFRGDLVKLIKSKWKMDLVFTDGRTWVFDRIGRTPER